MTPKTSANIALSAAGIRGELSKVDGVWYITGADFTNCRQTCLHVVRLSDMTEREIVEQARRWKAENEAAL